MNDLHHPVPLLRIFDEVQARRFYLEYLGFTSAWEHRFEDTAPLYMEVRRGQCVLHLTMHHGDACPGATLRIAVEDPDALLDELCSRAHAGLCPELEEVPWGPPELNLIDPFGNRLAFHRPAKASL